MQPNEYDWRFNMNTMIEFKYYDLRTVNYKTNTIEFKMANPIASHLKINTIEFIRELSDFDSI